MENVELSHIYQNVKLNHYFVVDKNVVDHHKELKSLLSTKTTYYIIQPEASKSFEEFENISTYFIQKGMKRGETLNVIGGGATLDLGGFVASTLFRGVPWTSYPTTLLAMIDAAIGGKVGINTKEGKNLIGAFHLPQAIYTCPSFLSSLPQDEILSGRGEMLKYTFLNEKIYQQFITDAPLSELITSCAQYKQHIIEQDFKELGVRKTLNLGHTFGHAIEKTLCIPHGLAVMIGLKLIIEIYSPQLISTYNELLLKFNLNIDIPRINFEIFWNFLKVDKKMKQKKISLIIPHRIGNVEIIELPLEKVEQDLRSYIHYDTFFE